MDERFYVPDKSVKNNSISQNDLDNGFIRIDVANKKFFPNDDCKIIVVVNSKEYSCEFRTNDNDGRDRSYKLFLGRNLINLLNIHTRDQLEFVRLNNNKYSIQK